MSKPKKERDWDWIWVAEIASHILLALAWLVGIVCIAYLYLRAV